MIEDNPTGEDAEADADAFDVLLRFSYILHMYFKLFTIFINIAIIFNNIQHVSTLLRLSRSAENSVLFSRLPRL